MNPNQYKLSTWIIVLTCLACLIGPAILKLPGCDFFALSSFGDLGSAIGGLTSPIIGLGGAILLYQTIKIQIQSQNEQKIRGSLILIIQLIKENIDDFQYQECFYNQKTKRNEATGDPKMGADAIYQLLQEVYCNGDHETVETTLTDPSLTAFLSILQMIKAAFDLLDKAKIGSKYALELMLIHQFKYRIFPRLCNEENLLGHHCEQCDRKHGLPEEYVTILTELKLRCAKNRYTDQQ